MEEKKENKTEEKIEELIKTGKINIFDIDREEDLIWAIGDLYCLEKHFNIILNRISEKLKEDPNNEYYKKLFDLASNLLNGIRIERTKHLKRIEKLEEFGFWCTYKHLVGSMMQFGEVGFKDIYMGEEENAKLDFETSSFCHDAIILLNQFAEKMKEINTSKTKK